METEIDKELVMGFFPILNQPLFSRYTFGKIEFTFVCDDKDIDSYDFKVEIRAFEIDDCSPNFKGSQTFSINKMDTIELIKTGRYYQIREIVLPTEHKFFADFVDGDGFVDGRFFFRIHLFCIDSEDFTFRANGYYKDVSSNKMFPFESRMSSIDDGIVSINRDLFR